MESDDQLKTIACRSWDKNAGVTGAAGGQMVRVTRCVITLYTTLPCHPPSNQCVLSQLFLSTRSSKAPMCQICLKFIPLGHQ